MNVFVEMTINISCSDLWLLVLISETGDALLISATDINVQDNCIRNLLSWLCAKGCKDILFVVKDLFA